MDVHYKPDAWQEMKEGIDKLTKDALMELKNANDLLEKIESKIHSLDSDRSIHFQHTSQQGKINQLLDDYITLGNYCTKAGEAVSRHIDEPFYKDMDKFAGKMRDLSIRNYSTKNRIGSTTTTTLPNAHGYGMAQTITTKKDKITVDDIFKDSLAFDKVLRAQYKEIKQENPDAKLDYAEYRKLVPSMRGFEYKTREDEQKNLETWRDLAIGAGLIILTIACPPAGLTASALYGGLQLKSAYDGKDWGTGRKLSDAERAENGIFGALDAIPVLGTAVKSFRGLDSVISMAKLSKMQEAGKVFNPNTGKNMVQSLHNSKNIWLHNLKTTGWKTADKINDWDHAIKSGVAKVVDGTTGGFNIAKDFVLGKSLAPVDGVMGLRRGTNWEAAVKASHDESKGMIHNKISKLEESVVGKGTGEVSNSGGNLSRIEYLRNKYGRFTPQELNDRINLRGAVAQEVERLNKLGISKREMGPAVAGTFDKTTGKYYFGINNTSGKIPEELHPLIEQRIINMPKNIKEGYTFTYGAGSHAEVYSLNQALLANPQASASNFITHVVRSGKKLKPAGMMMPTCPHCNFITEGFEFSSEVKKIEKSN
ncbi:YwqJ-related putative deaminase [Bacillus rhizoplanae]|uniref:YwqJ-related putative deaminase n=1 Tax=Bacillus rhizoplanae TaxID=2880966 RepID=UPI003D206080